MRRLVTFACVVGAGIMARNTAEKAWKAHFGTIPPKDPGDPATKWSEALLWSVVAGASVGLARTMIRGLLPFNTQPRLGEDGEPNKADVTMDSL